MNNKENGGVEEGEGDLEIDLNCTELIDITDEFLSACKEINASDFSKIATFKLSDAMSSIELMDPKMDAGMKMVERKLDNFSAALLSEISFAELIAILDATFAMFTSWINAQPMDQTVFTNMCLLNPNLLENCAPHLYTLSITILHIINLFKIYINTASVSNEEDISLMFIREPPKFSNDYVERKLNESISALNDQLKNKQQMGDQPRIDALSKRFQLLLSLLELFNYLLPSGKSLLSQGENNATNERFVPDFKKSASAVSKCIQLISKLSQTLSLGTQPNSAVDGDFSWLASVFDPNAYLYLSPPGFPRKPNLHSRADSYEYFAKFLEAISKMISGALGSIGSMDGIIDFLKQFGDEKSSVLTRSILQLIIMPNDHMICGTVSLNDIILNSMNRASGLFDGNGIEEILRVYFDVEPVLRALFNNLLKNFLVRGYIGIFQTLGNNLARQRERMLKTNFDDFGMIMNEANNLELEMELIRIKIANMHNAPPVMISSVQNIFTNFILHTTLDLMHYHFSLGFRLGLFQPYEFTYVYWYFGDIIARSLANLCERICNAMLMEFGKHPLIQEKKKISGKRLQQKTRMDNEFRRNLSRFKTQSIFYRVEMLMSNAMFKFTAALIASKQMAFPSREQFRYAKRVEQFQNVTSIMYFTYEDYMRESRISELVTVRPPQETFREAANYFGKTVALIKDLDLDVTERGRVGPTLLAIQQVAKKNMIVAKLMATQQMTKKISFEFCQPAEHFNFPQIGFSI